MEPNLDALGLAELIRLQERISQELAQRYGRKLAVAFTDVVGSTAYFARFGDEAGRRLQQRHFDVLGQVLPTHGGRVVDTAGDGAFTCFPTAEAACEAMVAVARAIQADNARYEPDQRLRLRMGLHHGLALTDGVVVTGDAVNLGARVASSADADELRLTAAAFRELSNKDRLRCRALGPVQVKGLPAPVEMYLLQWREQGALPSHVRVEETRQLFTLPLRDSISFGRLRLHDGKPANDVVLELADAAKTQAISRWHLEVKRMPGGLTAKALSERPTEIDGVRLARGEERAVKPGTSVRLGDAVSLTFLTLSNATDDD
ncbi:MAG: adenylate/guanylate cyclase domain-containing protein, partial [Myxococcaceae bacterium]|nr:adenylate/guanylate cyclase domain-containing protein [Myxococcaceae bacterium]